MPPRQRGVPRQWDPNLVGKVHGYPKTQEKWQARSDLMRQQVRLYNAEGITGRNGVPDGWAGKKKLIREIIDHSQMVAKVIVDNLIADKKWEPDNAESRVILEEAMAVVLAEKYTPEQQAVPLYSVKDRLQAMKMVWDMVQKKPASKQELELQKAEDFLAALVRE